MKSLDPRLNTVRGQMKVIYRPGLSDLKSFFINLYGPPNTGHQTELPYSVIV